MKRASGDLQDLLTVHNVQLVTLEVNCDNLEAPAELLESGAVKPVIDTVYPLSEAANAVAHMLGHHARSKVAIAV